MRRSRSKITIAALTAMTMVFTMIPGMAFAAEETGGTEAEPKTVTVTFSGETADGFDMQPVTLEVASDLTEQYYPDVTVEPKNEVTISDVLVAAHMEKYGEAFEKNPAAYYNVEDGTYKTGFALTQFERTGSSYMYYVNSLAPQEGICLTKVNDGDFVETGLYHDTETWSDVYGSFKSREYTAKEGEAVSVDLMAVNSRNEAAAIDDGAKIMLLDTKTGKVTDPIATADKDGTASLKFAKKGTYYITAIGTATYTGYTGAQVSGRFMMPYAKVTVAAKPVVKPAPVKKTLKTPVVTVKAGKKYAKISWKKVAGAKGYQVYRATSKNGTYKKIATVSAKKLSVKATKLKSGKKYYFKVRAYANSVKSSYSKVKAVKIK
ncbi:MAG: fibronectin type III domain-containing protein [Firmicutes bacterium]|nr:fibronectin type III domain-containing protein [Bacillota bacterium]